MQSSSAPLTSTDYGARLRPWLPQAAAYAWSLLRHQADAQDAVQQAALIGLQHLDRYDPARPFRAWWFTLLHHACIDLLRRRRPVLDPAAQTNPPIAPPTPDPAVAEALARALDRLDPAEAQILRLRYFADLNYAEIAAVLEIPRGTVMSRLHYARLALAAVLEKTNQ